MSGTPSTSSAIDDSPQVHVDVFIDSSEGLYFATSPEVQALGAGDSPKEAVEEFALNASDYIQFERENDRAGIVVTSEDVAALSPSANQEEYNNWLTYLKLDSTMKLEKASCDVQLKLEPPGNTAWIPIQEASEWPEVPEVP